MNVLLVGGGHAMLPALLRAPDYEEAGAAVMLLSASRYFYYSGMVPEYLGGVYAQGEVRVDLRRLCRQAGVRFVQGVATSVHPGRRRVTTQDGRTFGYDLAAFDVGTRPPAFPDGTSARDAIPAKPLHRVERLEQRVRNALADPAGDLRLAIAGGGAAGVEVALNLTARFHAAGRADALQIALVDTSERLLSAFPDGLSAWASRTLRRRGARLHLGRRAETLAGGRLHLSGGHAVPADAVLWATGTAAPRLFTKAGLPTDDGGFVRVHTSLRVRARERLFAAGDCARVAGHERLARIGVHAVKQGPVLAENLARSCRALSAGASVPCGALVSFRPYPLAPLVLSTGARTGLWTAGHAWLKGRPLLRLKHFLDRRWMRPYHDGRWRHAGPRDWLRADAPLGSPP